MSIQLLPFRTAATSMARNAFGRGLNLTTHSTTSALRAVLLSSTRQPQFQPNPHIGLVQSYKLETVVLPLHKLHANPRMSLRRFEELHVRFDMRQIKSAACTRTPTATSLSILTRLPRLPRACHTALLPLARHTMSYNTTSPITIMAMNPVIIMGIIV